MMGASSASRRNSFFRHVCTSSRVESTSDVQTKSIVRLHFFHVCTSSAVESTSDVQTTKMLQVAGDVVLEPT